MATLRFVILLHQVGTDFQRTDESHFDWMFESCGAESAVLKTWSTTCVDLQSSRIEVPALAIADHRIDYLEIQGDIGGNRGIVTQVASGRYRLIEEGPDCFVAELTWRSAERQGEYQRKLLIERRRAPTPEDDEAGSSWLRLSG